MIIKKGIIKMKDKFFRILSPITLIIVGVLNIAVIYFAVFAVKKLLAFTTAYAIFFAIMELFAIVIAVLITKSILTQGIKFSEESLEFTALDDNNIVRYCDIESVEIQKDEKASLKKNFNDRHSFVIFNMKDDTRLTVDIGLTSKKTLSKIKNEIDNRI